MISSLRQQAADIAADIMGLRRADRQPQYFIHTKKNPKKPVGFDSFINEVNKVYLMGCDDKGHVWKRRAEEIRKLTGVEQLDEELFDGIEVIRNLANAKKPVEVYGLQKAYQAIAALEEYANSKLDEGITKAKHIHNINKDKRVYKNARMTDRASMRDKRYLQDELESVTVEHRPHMHLVDGLWNIRVGLEQIMDKLSIPPLPHENSLER